MTAPANAIPDIAELARAWLAGRFEGNGLRGDQVRVARHETTVHDIPGAVVVTLKPQVQKSHVPGRVPHGEVLGSGQQALARANNAAGDFIRAPAVLHSIQDMLDHDPARGWGVADAKMHLPQTKTSFCCFESCQKCSGAGSLACTDCRATGQIPCMVCHATGVEANGHGGHGACHRCAGHGHTLCMRCNGQKKSDCKECAARGTWTDIWSVACVAELSFVCDPALIPPGAGAAVEILGLGALGAEGHAAITRGAPGVDGKAIFFPLTAHLPVSAVEFQVGGKPVPALAAGLKGRIVRIDTVLDACIKPGINALLRLSKGPLAAQALMGQACKYRILQDALSACAARSRKAAYNEILKEYPLVVSDKYARAAAQHGGAALDVLNARPRMTGLLLGIAAAFAVSVLYWFALREQVASEFARQAVAADVAVWLFSWGIAVMIIRLMVARGLGKILPAEIMARGKAPVSAGAFTLHAGLATLLAWACCAVTARPEWLAPLLHRAGF